MGWFDSSWGSILGGLQTGASLYGSEQSLKAAKETNATNVMLARENRSWLESMSNSEVQRKMKDLESAGLNPLIAAGAGAGASTPNVSAPQIENPGAGAEGAIGGAIANSVQSVLANQQLRAATEATEATARKTDAEAKLVEAQVPYSAANARTQSDILSRNFEKLGEEVGEVMMRTKKLQIEGTASARNLEDLRPLTVEYQKLLNAAEKAGIPEKEATAKFFENVPEAKWLAIIKALIK